MTYFKTDSPVGTVILETAQGGLSGLWIEGARDIPEIEEFSPLDDLHPAAKAALDWLDLYFKGQKPDFLPLLDLGGTAYQKAVFKSMLQVEYGNTASYKELAKISAKSLNRKGSSAQAAGNACSANRIMLIVPCHRIIKADGTLGGFSAGLKLKKLLLAHEIENSFSLQT